MGRKRVARITINIGAFFPKHKLAPEILHMSNILDSEAVGPLSASATDKYGEPVPGNFTWETDGAIGEEGEPMITLVVIAEGHPSLAAGTYVRAGDDVDGPASTVTGTSDVLDPDGNPFKVAEAFVVIASGATGATLSTGSAVAKEDLDAVPEPVPAPGDGGGNPGNGGNV